MLSEVVGVSFLSVIHLQSNWHTFITNYCDEGDAQTEDDDSRESDSLNMYVNVEKKYYSDAGDSIKLSPQPPQL